ncbi:MAG: endopeptidase La [Eubacteriales bacterium]|nr:endopeptidase La [Brotomerdimonas butyrica]MCI5998595.1 endopeptidase La [Eubacteriaceae bacterium]MCU6755919.1 endopeptidase La [Brotomerdimonas butyrica]MDD6476268.1 endopeptidase La [Eubacteriales bacterium]MDY3037635.1 endopeptidase La [Eubacteriales bacterium]
MQLPMIPLRGLSVFPNMVLHFDIGREKSINALEKAMVTNQHIFLASQKDDGTDLPTPEDFYHVGTVGKIKQMLKLPGDSIRVLVEGVCRGAIEDVMFEVPYFKCRIRKIEEPEYPADDAEAEALMRTVLSSFDEYINLNRNLAAEIFASVVTIEDPGRMADMIASHLEIKLEDKQRLLETIDPKERLETLNTMLTKEIEILNIEQDISSKVKSQINKNQREYYLREQMRAIQEELGVSEDVEDEVAGFTEQLEKLDLEEKTKEKVEKEISRFSKMQPSSAEATVSRNYIETILGLPWNTESEDNIDLNKAEEILNEDHYGLDKVKERVLEYLAVMQLSKGLKGPILCLVGPPGVGKTSIARSIARSIGREFVRMSLGGVRDEAEIRGHRRTYIGAIPGRIIGSIKDCGTKNPVFLLDEVDKIGADYKGDPASALLEVLDPEQNKDFTDHYLEVPFDLSKVMFITTANTTSTIPRPLLDRMEVLEVSGYTEEDKLQIAEKYLVPKQVKENGLTKSNISFTETGLRTLINYYTRESGVRNLEREIGNLCRKVAKNVVCGDTKKVSITGKKVQELLGKKRFRFDIIKGETEVGVTTGLAWTVVGGDTLFIETTAVPGNGKLVLTGQMGDVMQESAKAGLSYIRSVSKKLKIDEDFYKKYDLHVHIPEGAIPKDGPSAGVTMCTAIISTLTGIPVRKDIAMTGEITLRGKVLPVGGIREKVMAAHRAGIRKVLLPAENDVDIQDIPEVVRNDMEFVLLRNVDDALKEVLVKDKKNEDK